MKKLLAIILVLVISLTCMTSCAKLKDVVDSIKDIISGSKDPEDPHECESICDECGKCTDKTCKDDACEDKCKGHTPIVPEHECESVCPDCGKCTDKTCKDDACEDKCKGHKPVVPEHECESVCDECGKCTDKTCKDDACEDKCKGHTPVVPEHECESVCDECGKCTDKTCNDSACSDKCQGHTPVAPTYEYNDFTTDEKDLFTDTVGFVIPFIPNNDYLVDSYNDDGYIGVYLYTFGNTEAEFEAYLDLFDAAYTYDGEETDSEGYTWYLYSNGEVNIDICFDVYDGETFIYVDVWIDETVHECESVCDECGKCTDKTCEDSACSDKCEGHTPVEPETPTSTTVSKDYRDIAAGAGATANGDVVSGNIELDSVITVTFAQGSAANPPALYSESIRMYQKGATLTIKANGNYITQVVITVADHNSGKGPISVTGGTASALTNLKYTITANANTSEIVITTKGTDKNSRVYVAGIEVTYSGSGSGSVTPEDPDTNYKNNDFSASDKSTYQEYVGLVIPFIPNNDYSIEAYDEDGYKGVYFSAVGNTQAEFDAYKALFASKYTYDGTDTDDYGDTWYLYSSGNVYIDVCYYYYAGDYYTDVDAYIETNGSGGTGGSGGSTTDADVITNAGAGLPTDADGVYDVDFTKGENVKDVTDQGYYLDGCPTTGNPGVLVIPVEFSDVLASNKGYTIDAIKNAFNKDGVTDYYSVYDYYYMSSYGQLKLDITVLDYWFKPQYSSTYYKNQTMDYYGSETDIGDQMIIDEALKYLDTVKGMDLSQFDSDNNGTIDSVVLITTLEIDPDTTYYWAYRYWNIYTDNDGYYYEYDGVSANDYLWAPYQFLYEDAYGYNNTDGMNTYTFIHEFGHVLGADDYYDTSYGGGAPLDGYDIMDSMTGDHNAYSKFNFGWLTTSRLVVTKNSVTLTLTDFTDNGDTIIIANNWNEKLGAYQEYYVIVYYTNNGLNSGDGGYFEEEGILVYHVNASLYKEVQDGETYYDVYNNNTSVSGSDGYGTEDNLIEFVTSSDGDYLFESGESLGNVTDDLGKTLGYTFTVGATNGESATVTFTKR